MGKLFKLWLSPKGRVSRYPFVTSWSAMFIFMSLLSFITPALSLVLFLPLFMLPITIKRLHDIGMPSYYVVIVYQIYGLFFLFPEGVGEASLFGYQVTVDLFYAMLMWPTILSMFYLAIKRGEYGTNKYGIDPTWAYAPRVPLAEILSWRGISLKVGEKHK